MSYYNLSSQETLEKLESSENGLSQNEVDIRLQKVGLNEVTVKSTPLWKRLLSPFLDAFMLVLVFAAVISFFHGDNLDAIIIVVIVAINAIISYVQDFSTERILRELKKTSEQIVEVIRDGATAQVNKRFLVPGDIVLLSEGDKIPADGRIISSNSVRVNESLLQVKVSRCQRIAIRSKKKICKPTNKPTCFFKGHL
jgi:magnesium-transporting ATPase (P-type)